MQAGMLIILARTTSLDAFGVFGVTTAAGAIALGVLSFGLPTVLLRRGEEAALVNTAIRLSFVLGVMAAAISFVVGVLMSNQLWWVSIGGGVFIYSEVANNALQSAAFGRHAVRRADAVMLLRRAIPLIALLPAVLSNSSDAIVFGSLAAGCVLGVLVCALFFKREPNSGYLPARTVIGEALPYWRTNIWSMAQQSDVLVIGAIMGVSASAVFSAGFRLASPVHIVTALLTSQLIPELSRFVRGESKTNPSRLYIGVAVVYAGLILVLLPVLSWLAIVILGESYAGYGLVFGILFANSAISVVNQVVVGWWFGWNKSTEFVSRWTALSTFTGLCIVLIGALLGNLTLAALGTFSIQALLLLLLLVSKDRRK
jgi:O-antigen/teichoic acid export membrane protein